MKRKIIKINGEKCNGCGKCIPNCPEGAIQIIDGKARLVSDLFCDGLGACMGHCPMGAISIEERDAEPYDERKVMENIVKQGPNVVKAHLEHLKEHNESGYFKEAVNYLRNNKIDIPHLNFSGCPGSRMMDFSANKESNNLNITSQLRQWPVQLHLISPAATYFLNKDVLLAADCTAYALGEFHNHLKDKSLAIACPKLDDGKEVYAEKIQRMIDDAKINTLIVMAMEVPCCSGLLMLAKEAASKASRKIPIKSTVIGIQGKIISEKWVET
jgi:ferredoxin